MDHSYGKAMYDSWKLTCWQKSPTTGKPLPFFWELPAALQERLGALALDLANHDAEAHKKLCESRRTDMSLETVLKNAVKMETQRKQGSGRKTKSVPVEEGRVTVKIETAEDLDREILRGERIKAAAKKLYKQAEEIELAIIKALPLGMMVSLSDGRKAYLKDNFQDKDTGEFKNLNFGHGSVRHYEVEIK